MTACAFRVTKKDQYGVFYGDVMSDQFPLTTIRIYIPIEEAAYYLKVRELCVLQWHYQHDQVQLITIPWFKYDDVVKLMSDYRDVNRRIAKFKLDFRDNTFKSFTSSGDLKRTTKIDTRSYAIVTSIEKEGKFYWLHIVRSGDEWLLNKCFMAHGMQMMGKTRYVNRKMFEVGDIVSTYQAKFPKGNAQLVCFAPERVTSVDTLKQVIKMIKGYYYDCSSRRDCAHLTILSNVWNDDGTRKIPARKMITAKPAS